MSEPSYLSLYRSGELKRRADALEARLAGCDICPRRCGKDRLAGQTGFCHSGALPIVASVCAHHGEEPPISGTRGSGTVFFGNCNLRCVYCQNYQISQDHRKLRSREMGSHALAEQLLKLQGQGCHNINFVSPSHFVPQMVRAVFEAVQMGLKIPLVYNSSGYDSVDTLQMLDGIIDIYLPDIRYASDETARRFSSARNYVAHSRAAIKEMYRQVGNLVTDENGVAQRGLIVRHLILPDRLAGSEESLTWLAKEISPEVTVSVMAQYYPTHHAGRFLPLSRRINESEYDEVVDLLSRLGMDNGWFQDMDAPDSYRPDFDRDGHPFK
jgi:putative pyruvate formate lyase activating enzyme